MSLGAVTRRRLLLALVGTALCLLPARGSAGPDRMAVVEHPRWKKIFDAYGVVGTAVVYDLKTDQYEVYDPERAARKFTPASTFKIPHSLIALETGVVQDERQPVFRWDGTQRDIPDWNRDHTLRTAIKYSVVWVYQEIARQVGAEREARYVKGFDYGNGDTSGPVDQFWLGGPLRISAFGQIAFLKKLVGGELPVSERSVRIVRDILINDAGPTYVLRAKTGADFDAKIGWWVGWVEREDNAFFFAVNIDFPEMSNKRQEVTRAILREIGVLPPEGK